jgi:hypothetical protein
MNEKYLRDKGQKTRQKEEPLERLIEVIPDNEPLYYQEQMREGRWLCLNLHLFGWDRALQWVQEAYRTASRINFRALKMVVIGNPGALSDWENGIARFKFGKYGADYYFYPKAGIHPDEWSFVDAAQAFEREVRYRGGRSLRSTNTPTNPRLYSKEVYNQPETRRTLTAQAGQAKTAKSRSRVD